MQPTKEKIVAVIPTFNRKTILKECLDALLGQKYPLNSIIIIDGASSDGTRDFLLANGYLNNHKVDYIRLKENIGGCGGFSEGMKRGYEKGFDWIWLMDDDALPAKNSLEMMVNAIYKMGDRAFDCAMWNQIVFNKEDINCSNGEQISLESVESAMFVGFMINRKLIKKIGFPHGDYFMYWDDIEYSNRVIKNGGEIKKVINSKIYHKDWEHQPPITSYFLGKKIEIPDIPKWKFYYLIRNRLLMGRSDIKEFAKGVVSGLKWWIKILLVKPQFIATATIGILHGLIGKTGKQSNI